MDSSETDLEFDDSDDRNLSGSSPLRTVSVVLRVAAFVLTPLGFLGLASDDAWLSPTESPYVLVFAAGVVCAIGSIYIALYQHEIED